MDQDHSGLHANSIAAGWTTARIDRLTKLWVDGWSAGQIGRDLRVTRNAVIGMVHRRKLQRVAASRPMKIVYKAREPRITPNQVLAINAERRTAAQDPGLTLPASVPLPGSTPRPWPSRAFGECTWPVGDGEGPDLLSCCNKVHARGWCVVHFMRGTARPPAAKARPVGDQRHGRAA